MSSECAKRAGPLKVPNQVLLKSLWRRLCFKTPRTLLRRNISTLRCHWTPQTTDESACAKQLRSPCRRDRV